MSNISYQRFDEIDPAEFLPVLNSDRVRAHLVAHDYFARDTLATWMDSKLAIDATPGCRVRGIRLGDKLVGWCGIQPEDGRYEIAIIIDDKAWGLGRRIFNDLMSWARELDHEEIVIHFPNTRPQYRFLKKLATSVSQSEILGNPFTSYRISTRRYAPST